VPTEKTQILVSHGHLEALVESPADQPKGLAIVCHPHPLYGGTMHNNVVYRAAKALVRHGFMALRFNFRGVGTSTGTYGEGVAEVEDATAAIDWLKQRHPDLPVWATGMSFGARVALAAGVTDTRVTHLLGLGLVPRLFDFTFVAQSPKPKAFIHGERDELAAVESIRTLVGGFEQPCRLQVVTDASHLFVGKLDALDAELETTINFLNAPWG